MRVGVTSVGRDGEERDVIDSRIEKPRVRLPAGSLVATTDALLRASGIPHELLEDADVRTPLGRVLIARLQGAGAIEVAGPSAAADVRAVSDAMLAHGAEQALIDGAIDRRAASSPDVADGLIISTGAVLDHDIDEVVLQTRDAVELVRLATRRRRLADGPARCASWPPQRPASVLVDEDLEPVALPPRFVLLTAEAEQIAELLDENPSARWLIVAGALPDRFLRSLVQPRAQAPARAGARRRRPHQGVPVETRARVVSAPGRPPPDAQARSSCEAITVNPVAPQSHRFDSVQLRAAARGRRSPTCRSSTCCDPSH